VNTDHAVMGLENETQGAMNVQADQVSVNMGHHKEESETMIGEMYADL
jgi:hypothetical protein